MSQEELMAEIDRLMKELALMEADRDYWKRMHADLRQYCDREERMWGR